MNYIIKDGISLENYSYNIGETHKTFLKSTDLRSLSGRHSKLNSSDIRNAIKKNLGSSMWYIHSVLKNSSNLHQDVIDSIFNAENLNMFFDSLLKDKNHNTTIETSNQIPKKYDLEKSEIARMMVVKGLRYLSQSEKFKDNNETLQNIESINEDFKLLSESFFHEIVKNRSEDKSNEIISSKEYKFLESKLDKIHNESPVPLNYPHDMTFDSSFEKDLQLGRDETLKELFAIQNKIEYQNDSSDKKILLKKQKEFRKHLSDLDKTLELLEEKRTLEYMKLYLFVHPEIKLTQFLSNDEPIKSKLLIEKSKIIMEELKK